MDSKSIQIIRFKSSGDFEFTVEGIQLFQSIPGPLGIISVVGPPSSGKTTFCKKLMGSLNGVHSSTSGIWAWRETLKVIKRDEDGSEYKLDLLVIDCESITARADKNKTRGLEILALACLISSHIVYFTDQAIHTQQFTDLDIFAELPNLISVRKHVDSFKSLHEFLPVLTWVIFGPDLKAPEETAGSYFEKMLSSQGAAESARIKSSIKSFFRKRFCFNAVTGNKGQYHRMIEFIQQATTTKTTFNISLTGPILCSMLQSYVSKLSKKTPAVIQSAFNRAVATEARKNIERLYVRYLEQMTELESKLPCSEEELWMTHSSQVLELTSRFDRSMAEFTECPEILQEKKTVVHRMASFYEELKEANYKQSEEKSRKAFLCFFEPIRKNDEFLENVVEKKLEIIEGFQEFLSQTAGPAALKVFIEESSQVVSFLFGVIENLLKFNENCREDLENQVEELKKNREKTRINEQKMQKMFENSVKELESRLADKEVAFNDMQTTYNQKLTLTEAKVKNLTREIKAKDQEIEHLHLEKEAVLEMERNLFARKEEELEEIIEKLKEKINTLENEGEKKQLRLEQSISEKDEEIQELRQKEKFSESATESIQDYSMLSGLRRDISEMFILLETEQNNNSRFVALMDRIAALQAELNKCRLKEIENRNRLIEEYDEKIYALKDELEKVSQELNESKTGMIRKSEDVAPKIDDVVKSLEGEVKLKVEQNNLLAEMIRKRDEQIESLYQVIETHKKQFEGLELDFDDKETQMKKIKSELIQIRDDNDVLIGLMGYSLEVLQKKRNIQAISLAQIGSVSNRARVIKIFKKFGIPFEQ